MKISNSLKIIIKANIIISFGYFFIITEDLSNISLNISKIKK